MSARRDRTGRPLAASSAVTVDYTNRAAAYAHLRKLESLAARNPHDDMIGDLARSLRRLIESCEHATSERVH